MFKEYLLRLVKRAFRETIGLVIGRSLYGWLVKALILAVFLTYLFAFTSWSPAHDDAVFWNRVTQTFLTIAATTTVLPVIFVVELLLVSPYALWKAERTRAESLVEGETPAERDRRLEDEESARERAKLKVKANLMRERAGTRRHGFGGYSDNHLAAMWDAEQRGEIYDELHDSTFALTRSSARKP